MTRQAIVVGGGIGGLCAAIGLRKAGWGVLVVERAGEFGDIGAGITLWPNALRALDALGLASKIEPLMKPQSAGRLRDHHGRWLTRWDGDPIEAALGKPMLGIYRPDLLRILREALPAEALRAASEVTDVTADGKVEVNGEWLPADVVIGADGIRSTVRRKLWPDEPQPRYVGATAFRAVIDDPGRTALSGILGPGVEIGMVPLAGERLYWYVSFNNPADVRVEDPKRFLQQRYAGWPEPVEAVIERTPAEAILHHDLYELAKPLRSYVDGKVALLGDAAHAMPPYLGQGGCQAIEDAVELAAALGSGSDVTSSLAAYDQVRRPRSQSIAKQSTQAGRIGAQLSNPVAVRARNALIRLTPDAVTIRAAVRPTRWDAPEI